MLNKTFWVLAGLRSRMYSAISIIVMSPKVSAHSSSIPPVIRRSFPVLKGAIAVLLWLWLIIYNIDFLVRYARLILNIYRLYPAGEYCLAEQVKKCSL